MKKICFVIKMITCIVIIIWIMMFVGCTFVNNDTRETYVDPSGNAYTILNKNYFRFDTYDTLEIIVSENERFVLYDCTNDHAEEGIGEWIKNGTSIPVWFYNDNHMAYNIHGDIIIYPNEDACRYLDQDDRQQLTPFIAKIKNDTEHVCLYWWESGNYRYNDQYSSEVSVNYKTWKRSENNQWAYIPERAYSFYSISNQGTTYICEEAFITFDGNTGLGTWTVNGQKIPVIASFDKESFIFILRFNTTDDRKGKVIFECAGESINEMEAIYSVSICPDFYDASFMFKMIKQ